MAETLLREEVVAQTADEIPVIVDIGLYLGEYIRSMLDIVAVVLELIGHQVIAHIVPADDHGAPAVRSQIVCIDTADSMLHVAVVTDIRLVEKQPVALVVLVEAI